MTHEGWVPEPWMQLEAVPRIPAVDSDDFEKQIIRARQPVIIDGWLDDWDAVGKWSIDYFVEKCGDQEIRLRFIGKDQDGFRKWERDTTLREWLEELRQGQKDDLYLAEVALGETLPQVVEDIGTVAYGNRDPKRLNLMMGRRTYAPFHFHERHDAVAVQVVGNKNFVLYGPSESKKLYPQPWFQADQSFANVAFHDTAKVDLDRYPRFRHARGYECTMTPGDALFIPMHWWHAVHGGDEFNVLLTDFYFSEATDTWTYPFPGVRLWARRLGLAEIRMSLKRGSLIKDLKKRLSRSTG